MISVTTQSNFTVSINEKILKDWDFVCNLADIQSEETSDVQKMHLMKNIQEQLLGKEQLKELKQHVRKYSDGICDAESLMREITDIVEKVKENKETKNS